MADETLEQLTDRFKEVSEEMQELKRKHRIRYYRTGATSPPRYGVLEKEFHELRDKIYPLIKDKPEWIELVKQHDAATGRDSPIVIEAETAPDPTKSPSWGSPGGEDPPETIEELEKRIERLQVRRRNNSDYRLRGAADDIQDAKERWEDAVRELRDAQSKLQIKRAAQQRLHMTDVPAESPMSAEQKAAERKTNVEKFGLLVQKLNLAVKHKSQLKKVKDLEKDRRQIRTETSHATRRALQNEIESARNTLNGITDQLKEINKRLGMPSGKLYSVSLDPVFDAIFGPAWKTWTANRISQAMNALQGLTWTPRPGATKFLEEDMLDIAEQMRKEQGMEPLNKEAIEELWRRTETPIDYGQRPVSEPTAELIRKATEARVRAEAEAAKAKEPVTPKPLAEVITLHQKPDPSVWQRFTSGKNPMLDWSYLVEFENTKTLTDFNNLLKRMWMHNHEFWETERPGVYKVMQETINDPKLLENMWRAMGGEGPIESYIPEKIHDPLSEEPKLELMTEESMEARMARERADIERAKATKKMLAKQIHEPPYRDPVMDTRLRTPIGVERYGFDYVDEGPGKSGTRQIYPKIPAVRPQYEIMPRHEIMRRPDWTPAERARSGRIGGVSEYPTELPTAERLREIPEDMARRVTAKLGGEYQQALAPQGGGRAPGHAREVDPRIQPKTVEESPEEFHRRTQGARFDPTEMDAPVQGPQETTPEFMRRQTLHYHLIRTRDQIDKIRQRNPELSYDEASRRAADDVLHGRDKFRSIKGGPEPKVESRAAYESPRIETIPTDKPHKWKPPLVDRPWFHRLLKWGGAAGEVAFVYHLADIISDPYLTPGEKLRGSGELVTTFADLGAHIPFEDVAEAIEDYESGVPLGPGVTEYPSAHTEWAIVSGIPTKREIGGGPQPLRTKWGEDATYHDVKALETRPAKDVPVPRIEPPPPEVTLGPGKPIRGPQSRQDIKAEEEWYRRYGLERSTEPEPWHGIPSPKVDYEGRPTYDVPVIDLEDW